MTEMLARMGVSVPFIHFPLPGLTEFPTPWPAAGHATNLGSFAPAVLNGTPLLPQSGQREFAAEVSWDLPSLAPRATSLIDVSVSGARASDLAQASLVSSTRFIELNAAVWSNNTVRVMARNISGATFDLAAATLSVGVTKRRVL